MKAEIWAIYKCCRISSVQFECRKGWFQKYLRKSSQVQTCSSVASEPIPFTLMALSRTAASSLALKLGAGVTVPSLFRTFNTLQIIVWNQNMFILPKAQVLHIMQHKNHTNYSDHFNKAEVRFFSRFVGGAPFFFLFRVSHSQPLIFISYNLWHPCFNSFKTRLKPLFCHTR